MNNNFLIDFQSMTIEQLKQWIISQNLTLEELEPYNKGTEMFDKASKLNNYQNKIIVKCQNMSNSMI